MLGNNTPKCLQRVLKVCPTGSEDENMKLSVFSAGRAPRGVAGGVTQTDQSNLIKNNTDINLNHVALHLRAEQDSECRWESGRVGPCEGMAPAPVLLLCGSKGDLDILVAVAGSGLWRGGLMADLENSRGPYVSSERTRRDGLGCRNSRVTESRLGRSRDSPILW